jgi:hypothetical protein
MKLKKNYRLAIAMLFLPLFAVAHPGHTHEGGTSNLITHIVLTSIPLIIVAFFVFRWVILSRKRQLKQKRILSSK